MDTKKLMMLLETIHAGSLKKAAETLNYSQAGLIYTMNSLEQELGVNLLFRNSKGVSLTPEGRELEPFIQKIVDGEIQLMNKLSELKEGGRNKLRIGSYPIFACYCLPSAIKSFLAQYPDVEVSIHVGTAENIPKWLEDNVIDLAIGEPCSVGKGKWIHLVDDETYVAFPVKYPIPPDRTSISIQECMDYPVLHSTYNPASIEAEKLIGKQATKIIVSSQDGSALLCMVEEGLGIAFLSSLYLNECPATIRMLPLESPIMRELGIILDPKRPSSPIVQRFIAHLQKVDWTVIK